MLSMLNKSIEQIKAIEHIETPCYFYDMDILDKTIDTIKKYSSKYGFKIHYAMKANFEQRIIKHMAQAGLGADCVSGGEVERAIACGIPSEEIVFAGVGKSDPEIIYGLDNDIFCFNCESLEELNIINSLARERGKCANIALRINPDVEPQTHKHISTGQADSKFGISYTEVDKAIESLNKLPNIKIVGLHFHIGSQILNLDVFNNLCSKVNNIANWFEKQGITLEHLNVGGGLGIDYTDPKKNTIPDFERYFDIFAKGITLKENQTLHFELGRSVVAQCGILVSKVLLNKTTASDKNFVIVDAAMTELMRPALYQAHHLIENISSHEKECVYSVAGGVCESTDIFARNIKLSKTKRGDLIVFYSAGAYGSAMASNYNLRELKPAIYSSDLNDQ